MLVILNLKAEFSIHFVHTLVADVSKKCFNLAIAIILKIVLRSR